MLLLKILIITWIFGSIVSLITFVIDVHKWHDREEDTVVIPSAYDPTISRESEVTENAADDREHNTSTLSFPWCQS